MADQRYMKKPVVVDAYQLPAAGQDLPESFQQWCERVGFTEFESGRAETLVIPTLEGDMTAQPGDWIIRGVRGEFYPCKPDIFAATYEAEPEASAPAADEVPDAVIDAVAEAIGGAYDCTRAWSAWSFGTMGPDDFSRVAEDGERVAEIALAALTAARSMAAPEQAARKVLDAALQWWCEREINDWDEADLARALIDYEGDWRGCPGCDHDCGEPCTPATAAQQHAAIDHRIADLVHEGKLHPPDGYTPPDGWQPGPAPQSRQQRVRAAMQQADRTPTDYALEHAEYLAQAAEGFIDECNELAKAEMARDELCGDECEAATKAADEKVWQAKEAISEGMGQLRDRIHGFRTRRDRAAKASLGPAPTDQTASMPTLPQSLLNIIGEYGMARTDGLSEASRLHLWKQLIAGIKAYAAQATAGRTPPEHTPKSLTDERIDAAARVLARCMDYPWEYMPERGRQEMRNHAQAVAATAIGIALPSQEPT